MKDPVKFIYIMDPLCGWCYGFSQVACLLHDMYSHLMEFELTVGGLMEGSQGGPLKKVAGFIPDALRHVEETCQVEFGELYLENIIEGNDILNSRPLNLLIKTAGWLKPQRAYHAAAAVQKAHYEMGIPCDSQSEFAYVMETSGINSADLINHSSSDKSLQLLMRDYQFVREMQITGFPCCLLETSDGYQILSQGYHTLEEMKSKIEQCLPEITQYY